MAFEAKNFDHLIGTPGFSDTLLKNHFTLYQGYVNNTNKLLDMLATLVKEGRTASPEYAELKRRLGWEFNGMRLHEFYFWNLAKSGRSLDHNSDFYRKILHDFGSFENWEKDFRSAGTMRGIGWVVLYYEPSSEKLLNVWINEHDLGHLAGATPILVMDVFEHAYMIDYGLKRADYIESFFRNLDWKACTERMDRVKSS